MTTYAVHKLLKRIRMDAEFRTQLEQDPAAVLDGFMLSAEERTALEAGEVGVLNALGVHGYLLNTLARYQVFGLTPERYMERIRQVPPLTTSR